MLRISAVIAVLALIGTTAGVSVASADWGFGCSYDKCIAACQRDGGKFAHIFAIRSLRKGDQQTLVSSW
jgi:hypothetical protein